MATAVKLSEAIVFEAKKRSKALNRSIAGQIEHWARIGKIAEENPELTYQFIKDILIAQHEVQLGRLEPFILTKKNENPTNTKIQKPSKKVT